MSAATVLSDYVVTDELLGEGALSTVRLAQNLSTGKPVAVKIIPKKDLTLFEKETVFIECEVLKILNHDHIVKLLDFYEDKENYYVFLQYIAGGNLHDFLRRTGKLQQGKNPLPFFFSCLSCLSSFPLPLLIFFLPPSEGENSNLSLSSFFVLFFFF